MKGMKIYEISHNTDGYQEVSIDWLCGNINMIITEVGQAIFVSPGIMGRVPR